MKKLFIFLFIIAVLVAGRFILPKFIPQFANRQHGLVLSGSQATMTGEVMTGDMMSGGVTTGSDMTGATTSGDATLTSGDEALINGIVNDVLKQAQQ